MSSSGRGIMPVTEPRAGVTGTSVFRMRLTDPRRCTSSALGIRVGSGAVGSGGRGAVVRIRGLRMGVRRPDHVASACSAVFRGFPGVFSSSGRSGSAGMANSAVRPAFLARLAGFPRLAAAGSRGAVLCRQHGGVRVVGMAVHGQSGVASPRSVSARSVPSPGCGLVDSRVASSADGSLMVFIGGFLSLTPTGMRSVRIGSGTGNASWRRRTGPALPTAGRSLLI